MSKDQGSPQPGQQAQAGEASESGESPGAASELLLQINENLSKLGDLISRSPLPDEDKQAFDQLAGAFSAFADSLGESPSNAPKGPQAPVGVNAPETGGKQAMPVGY